MERCNGKNKPGDADCFCFLVDTFFLKDRKSGTTPGVVKVETFYIPGINDCPCNEHSRSIARQKITPESKVELVKTENDPGETSGEKGAAPPIFPEQRNAILEQIKAAQEQLRGAHEGLRDALKERYILDSISADRIKTISSRYSLSPGDHSAINDAGNVQ